MLNTKNKHARKMSNEIICKLIITYSRFKGSRGPRFKGFKGSRGLRGQYPF